MLYSLLCISKMEKIQIGNDKNLALETNVRLSPNDLIASYAFNRENKKLIQNDKALLDLYKQILKNLKISDWVEGEIYNVGRYVWYRANGWLYLLKCIIPSNSQQPNLEMDAEDLKTINNSDVQSRSQLMNDLIDDNRLKNSGWENCSKYLTIIDYGIETLLLSEVEKEIDFHVKEKHPYGKINGQNGDVDYIGNTLLYTDFHNIDRKRDTVFFPLEMDKINEQKNAVLDGYVKNYGEIIEYDILFKFGNEDDLNEMHIFDSSSELSANIAKFQFYGGIGTNGYNYQKNELYFQNNDALNIFSYVNDAVSRKGLIVQDNMNDFVNVYAATILFDKKFIDLNYMVFANSILSEAVDESTGKKLVPSPNDIVVCNKTRESVTFLDIMYMNKDKYSEKNYNATNYGLASNSFHCKIIGKIGG